MSKDEILPFLNNLSENNNRDWMHEHKKEKEAATNSFLNLIEKIQAELSFYEPKITNYPAKQLIFRLNRDLRYTHDKTPYNPTFRAHIGPNGKLFAQAGLYIQISPDFKPSFLGGGFYGIQFTDAINQIRDYLLNHPQEFLSIINEPEFKKNFTVQGEKLKRFPRGYEETGTEIDEFIKHKSWYLERDFHFSDFKTDEEFVKFCGEIFRIMKPLNDYLNAALLNFKIPKR